jgi:hypothetical protein
VHDPLLLVIFFMDFLIGLLSKCIARAIILCNRRIYFVYQYSCTVQPHTVHAFVVFTTWAGSTTRNIDQLCQNQVPAAAFPLAPRRWASRVQAAFLSAAVHITVAQPDQRRNQSCRFQ